jgi:hypothetical protein
MSVPDSGDDLEGRLRLALRAAQALAAAGGGQP